MISPTFRTSVTIRTAPVPVSYQQPVMLMGSCFADNMGSMLRDMGLPCCINPFGTLYNPVSIDRSLRRLISGSTYTAADLFSYQGLWNSWDHHGAFSHPEADVCLDHINTSLRDGTRHLATASHLFLTLGTAYIYRLRQTGQVVANCHKVPLSEFIPSMLTVQEVRDTLTSVIAAVHRFNANLQVVVSVSPVRHHKEDLHLNTVSKAILLSAVAELQQTFPEVLYFPSYELMNDELRDYRFYDEDMVHPSPLAMRYIGDRFADAFFSHETQALALQVSKLRKALHHRPLHPDTEEYHRFKETTIQQVKALQQQYPSICFDSDLA